MVRPKRRRAIPRIPGPPITVILLRNNNHQPPSSPASFLGESHANLSLLDCYESSPNQPTGKHQSTQKAPPALYCLLISLSWLPHRFATANKAIITGAGATALHVDCRLTPHPNPTTDTIPITPSRFHLSSHRRTLQPAIRLYRRLISSTSIHEYRYN